MEIKLRTGIDTRVEEESRKIKRSRLLRSDGRSGAFLIGVQVVGIHVDGGVQRRAAPPVPDMRIGTAFEEEPGGVVCEVIYRHDQRRDAVRVRLVGIRTGVEHRRHAVLTTRASRV